MRNTLRLNNSDDDHNLYGAHQSQSYASSGVKNSPIMIISSSTAYVNSWNGNTGRVIGYLKANDTFNTVLSTILSLSACGMNNIGFKWDYDHPVDY